MQEGLATMSSEEWLGTWGYSACWRGVREGLPSHREASPHAGRIQGRSYSAGASTLRGAGPLGCLTLLGHDLDVHLPKVL